MSCRHRRLPEPFIHAVKIDGNKAIPASDLLSKLRVSAGKPLQNDELKFSVNFIESSYRDKGYYQVAVSTALHPVEDGQVDVHFIIEEGPLFHVGTIHIQGNRRIEDKVILRALDVHPGDIFSQSKMFEGSRQLYVTGYFEGIDFVYSTTAAHVVDIAMTVRERATRYLKGGSGYGSETKERVILGYEDLNFLGNARKLDITGTYSGFVTHPSYNRTTLLQATLTQPNLLDTRYEGQTNLAHEWDDRQSYDSVSTAWLSSIGRRFATTLTASLRYRYQGTRVTDVSEQADTPGFTNISAVGPTFTYDNTNDPFLPARGWRIIGTYEEGMRFIVGDVRFHKLENHTGRFDTVAGEWTFFEGLQAGEIIPGSTSAQDIIPIYERYFIGGANTVRGYSERQLGPRDSSGNPLGGNAFLVGNFEVRHPLYKKLFGEVFIDGGQLYATDPGHVWPSVRMTGLNDFRYGTGFGFRLQSPVGAVRLELGYQLNPEEASGFYNRTAVHFSIGEVF